MTWLRDKILFSHNSSQSPNFSVKVTECCTESRHTCVRNSSRVTVGVGANDDADADGSPLAPPSDRIVAAADADAAIIAPLNSVSAGDAEVEARPV